MTRKRTDAHEAETQSKRAHRSQGLSPLIVFAHGAGAPSSSEWMQRWKQLIADATGAVEVVTFDYPYFQGGKKRAPPKAEKLIGPHVEEVRKALAKHPGHPLVLVGKSMGSRVSCMVAKQEGCKVSAIVCLGYPLKGTNGTLRDEILLDLQIPIIFVQGSKDALCPLDKLQGVIEKLKCPSKLHIIEGGDHSFKVSKKMIEGCSLSQEKLEEQAVNAINSFLEEALDF